MTQLSVFYARVLNEVPLISDRNKGVYKRSSQTKRKLIQAAIALAADKSTDSLTFSDIAKQTGVARGTIYTYFRDVDALISDASAQLWRSYRLEIALIIRQVDDAALKVALPLFYFFEQAREDSVFAWFMIRNRFISADNSSQLHADMRGILRQGIADKRFSLADDEVETAITLLRGVTTLGIQNVLSGSSAVNESQKILKLVLQAFGLSADEAYKVSVNPSLKSLVQDRRLTHRLIKS